MRCKHSGQTTTLFDRAAGSRERALSDSLQRTMNRRARINPPMCFSSVGALVGVTLSPVSRLISEQIRCVHYFRSWDQ